MPETLVVALGGNAITRSGEAGAIPQQFAHTAETLEALKSIFRSGRRVAITHGSGPQIGNILIRVEEGERRVPRLPLDTCDADCQGGMGYMIQRLACDLFRREGIRREAATIITQVLVDRGDPAFADPSKPIGAEYTAEQAALLRTSALHWMLRETAPGRFRRVVPSPRPLEILESGAIASLLDAGVVVIACGGGGIPVAWEGDRLAGVEAVIDKDLASSLLARRVRAQRLVVVTSVERVALRYGRPGQRWLDRMTLAEARGWLAAGEFAAGSMRPKMEAAIEFLEHGGEECIVTSPEQAARALEGEGGTRIVP
jgi:carbamate kinase